MRRVNLSRDERGATAVVVAIMLVVLVGFGALAVDIGAVWWDRKQLQNGADAAALALAEQCAKDGCPADDLAQAAALAAGNKLDDSVSVAQITYDPSKAGATSVQVWLTTNRDHWFAPVIGMDDSNVGAAAKVTWGGIGKETVLPLTIKMCNGEPAVGQELHIVVRDQGSQSSGTDPCDNEKNFEGSPGHYEPGSWGWLKPDGDDCLVETSAGGVVAGDTGGNVDKDCQEKLKDLDKQEHILLPIFETSSGTGAGTKYQLVGYVALKVTAYCLSHNIAGLQANVTEDTPECKNANDKWILGTFVRFVGLGAEIGGPDYGATTVQLVLPDSAP